MRKIVVVCCLLWPSVASAQSPNPWGWYRRGGGPTYNPNYGYSDRVGRGYRGNSSPSQGNFRFAPGYGYGSIYGNSGHPGFNRFTGPSWASPYAW